MNEIGNPMTAPGRLSEQFLFRRLATLNLDSDHYVIFGSGPLLAHGLRAVISDLDIVARGPAWARANALGEPAIGPLNGAPMVRFWDGLIEVSNGWVSPEWDVDTLISEADVIDGFRFVQLRHVLTYKRSLSRSKDLLDISNLEKRLRVDSRQPLTA